MSNNNHPITFGRIHDLEEESIMAVRLNGRLIGLLVKERADIWEPNESLSQHLPLLRPTNGYSFAKKAVIAEYDICYPPKLT